MNRLLTVGILRNLIIAESMFVGGIASAQQPGTNIATPPPSTGMSTQMEDPVPGLQQNSQSGLAAEPVIPAESSKRVYPNRPLMITGLVLLGGSYGASAIVAASSSLGADDRLYYPVAGPWMDLHRRGCNLSHCSTSTLDEALLIGDGVLQGIGALGMLLSLVVPEKTTEHWYLIGNERLTVFPLVGSVTGLGATSRF
jgi:hypothetical protein